MGVDRKSNSVLSIHLFPSQIIAPFSLEYLFPPKLGAVLFASRIPSLYSESKIRDLRFEDSESKIQDLFRDSESKIQDLFRDSESKIQDLFGDSEC
jgi:hypothetical protein